MIKHFVCVLLVVTIAMVVFAGRGLEEDILSRCKHVECKNVADLKLEANIRHCVKTTCKSKYLRDFEKECEKDCKDEVKSRRDNVSGEPVEIIDYDWLD